MEIADLIVGASARLHEWARDLPPAESSLIAGLLGVFPGFLVGYRRSLKDRWSELASLSWGWLVLYGALTLLVVVVVFGGALSFTWNKFSWTFFVSLVLCFFFALPTGAYADIQDRFKGRVPRAMWPLSERLRRYGILGLFAFFLLYFTIRILAGLE